MALTVNTNIAAVDALGSLNRTNRRLGGVFTHISSGLRINSAADDAAGMAVAENLNASAGSLRQSMRNTNDGISLIQTAEGATNEVGNILKRIRELAVQGSSETLADDERAYIQDEFEQLASEIDRIAVTTNFNRVQLTDGTTTGLDVQVGILDSSNDRIAIELGDLRSTTLGVDAATLDLSTASSAQSALTALDSALDSVSSVRSGFGAVQNRLESALNNLETYQENLTGAESRIRDADFAFETAEMAKLTIIQESGVAVLGQANSMNSGAVSLIQ